MLKEARARIKIDKLLEKAGWRFLPSNAGPENVRLEEKTKKISDLGENYENTKNGYIPLPKLQEQKEIAAEIEAE